MSEIKYLVEQTKAIKVSIFDEENKNEIARGYLYLIKNDLHKEPYGLIEDVFVDENNRKKGLGNKIVQALIKEAKKQNCYKLLAQSRHTNTQIHEWYSKLGFENYGLNFRLNLK